jgi:hypothetical protein
MNDSAKNRYAIIALILATFCLAYYDLILCNTVFIHDSITFYGIAHYYLENMAAGQFPYWDPYLTTGTYFYPNVPVVGLLDPLFLFGVAAVKFLHLSPLTAYIHITLARLFITALGAFFLFRHITKSSISALLGAGVLLLAFPHSYFPQFGVVGHLYLTPFVLYLILLFLENPAGPYKLLQLALLTVLLGIAMNIYIPAHFSFNIIVFFVGALILGIPRLNVVKTGLGNARTLVFMAVLLAALLLMLAPPVSVLIKDASNDGELFPMQRIVQKNNRLFKQLMATEVNTSNLSDKFTNEKAIYSSWGNLVGLLYPDNVRNFKYWFENDLTSEIHHYIGIIPFLVCLIGLIYHRSKYKLLLALTAALMFINGFSPYGTHDKPFTFLQNFLNTAYPPLKMLQGRQNFGYFDILYLCAFFSMGMSLLLDDAFLKEKKWQMIALSLTVLVSKIIISSYFEGAAVLSGYDLLVLLMIAGFGVLVYIRAHGAIPRSAFYFTVIVVIFLDLLAYNTLYRDEILQDSKPFYDSLNSIKSTGSGANDFGYFREPLVFMPLPHLIAFEESIAKTKGALSYGFNHSFFTTRRYYDFLTHVPLQNQFALDGVVYPVLQFFPRNSVTHINDKRQLLDLLTSGDMADVTNKLFIETGDTARRGQQEMKEFGQYADVPWLQPNALVNFSESFFKANSATMTAIRNNTDRSLHNAQVTIDVLNFSSNELTLQVRNAVEGYVYYNDGWSKYWQAFDGEQEIPIVAANYNFKAVELPAGEHQLRFVFNPVHYRIGLCAYYLGLSLCCGLICLVLIKNRR